MTAVLLAVSLVIPIVIGYGLVRACVPGGKRLCRHDWLRLFLGIGVGFGVCSGAFFVWLLTYGRVHQLYIMAEIGLALCVAIIANRRATCCRLCEYSKQYEACRDRRSLLLLIAFGLVLVCALASFALESGTHPEGQGDAWAIWNLRARYLFRGGDQWRAGFSPGLFWSHPDYPLLLPGAVARSWIYTGAQVSGAPIGIAALFTFAIVGVLTAGLSAIAGRERGLLAGLLLLGTGSFVKLGAAQYADVPVSFFVLVTITLLLLEDRLPVSGLVLIGTTAALAAWTKNEGLVFLAILVVTRKLNHRPIRSIFLGASWVIVLLAILKLSLAPTNPILGQDWKAVFIQDVTNPSRYGLVAAGLLYQLVRFGGQGPLNPLIPLSAALLLLERKQKRRIHAAELLLAGTGMIVLIVYVLTPYNLAWHVAWSLDRVMLQFWPALLLTSFCPLEPTAVSVSSPESIAPHTGPENRIFGSGGC
jgi:hypothetical protein